MAVDYKILIAYIAGIIILFLLGKVLLVPLKVLIKLIINALIGGIVLLVINLIGGFIGFHIAFNIVSAIIVGTLGIPGVILLIVLKLIFKM
jgi:inhibitor of the pro-sigma K processing machinery